MTILKRAISLPAVLITGLLTVSPPAAPISQAETDYGEISMYLADTLQKRHYSRRKFDDEVSAQLLESYLRFLDFDHQYFTQEDIARFDRLYKESLDDQILLGDISAAHDIYKTFDKRVRDRIVFIRKLIETEKFTFASDRKIDASRKESPWPKNAEAADVLWRNIIEGQLLQEKLRLTVTENEEEETVPDGEKEIILKEKSDGGDLKVINTDGISEPVGKETNITKEIEISETKTKDDEEVAKTPEEKLLKRYDQILEGLSENDEEDVVNIFLTALTNVYDPHSDWFSQSELENFTIGMKNSLVGIGALLSMKEGAAEIQGLVINGPAERGGELKVGDRIVGVAQGEDGKMEDIMFLKINKVVGKIRGEKETIVRLKIVPADAEDPSMTDIISVVRDEVKLIDKLATGQVIETQNAEGEPSRLGWISVPSFYADLEGKTTSLTKDVRKLLDRLISEKVSGVILDLRGNGGGSLDEAIKMTGLFIKRGPVVQIRDWRNRVDTRSSRNRFPVYDGPLVVLTGKASASASEILAAALQDYNRAVIVGESSTFGKGTVQTVYNMANEIPYLRRDSRSGALKVTIQKFYRVSGGSTQLKGVVPDIVFPSTRDALDIGEASLDSPLPWDEINAMKIPLSNEENLALKSELSSRHKARIGKSPEFQYVIEDTKRLKEQIERNTLSLNESERLAEVERNKKRRDARKKERIELVAKTEDSNPERFKIYRLTLDNVADAELKLESEFSDEDSSGMILGDRNKSKKNERIFPYDITPNKLEALEILQDLIQLSKPAQTAKVN